MAAASRKAREISVRRRPTACRVQGKNCGRGASQFRGANVPGDHTWALSSRISGWQNPVKQLAGRRPAARPRILPANSAVSQKSAQQAPNVAGCSRDDEFNRNAGRSQPSNCKDCSSAGATTLNSRRAFAGICQIAASGYRRRFQLGRRHDELARPRPPAPFEARREQPSWIGARSTSKGCESLPLALRAVIVRHRHFTHFHKFTVRWGGLTKVFRFPAKVGGKLYRLERLCRLSWPHRPSARWKPLTISRHPPLKFANESDHDETPPIRCRRGGLSGVGR